MKSKNPDFMPSKLSMRTSSVINAIQKNNRMSKDRLAVRSVKVALSVRDSLNMHSSGKVINGRQLMEPQVI